MMQKLIDAYELERTMYRKCIDTDEEIEKGRAKWDSGLWIRYKVFEDAVDDAPTVDPVRHGHWNENNDGTLWCSVCISEAPCEEDYWGYVLNAPHYDYCPNCGAKMDEVDDDT